MVCKNCGADLKPGIKYCLECGNYVDDDDLESSSSSNGSMNGPTGYKLKSVKKKSKKKKIRITDILIYAGLSVIIIVSILVIIYTLSNNSHEEEVVPQPTVVTGDETLHIDDYEITVPKSLNHDVQGSTLYISDDKNYTLSYRNTDDDYDMYSSDLEFVREDLEANNYEVESIDKRDVASREFIICTIRVSGKMKYLYMTPLGNRYTTMGVIETFESGDWTSALEVVADINDTAVFDDIHKETYSSTKETTKETTKDSSNTGNDNSKSGGKTTTRSHSETYEYSTTRQSSDNTNSNNNS